MPAIYEVTQSHLTKLGREEINEISRDFTRDSKYFPEIQGFYGSSMRSQIATYIRHMPTQARQAETILRVVCKNLIQAVPFDLHEPKLTTVLVVYESLNHTYFALLTSIFWVGLRRSVPVVEICGELDER